MITTKLLQGGLSIIRGILSLLPDFSWNITSDGFQTALGVVGSICYLLPIGTILVIVGLTVSFHIFRAIVAFVKTIWDLLPIV